MYIYRLAAVVVLIASAPAVDAIMTRTVGNGGIGGFLDDALYLSGEHYHLGCDDGEVLVGVHGRQGSWINRIGIRCVKVDVQGRWDGNVYNGPAVGGDGDVFTRDIEPTDCPRNNAVVGFRGKYGSYVDKLELECRPLADAEHADGPTSMIGPFGGEGGTGFDTISCDGARAATGIYGRAGIYVDKLGLKCAHERVWMPDYHYFPQLDAGNESSWMNDPSGLILQDGVYHLYYQSAHVPARFDPNQVHWDHASSRDLLNWTDHPRVFSPASGAERDGSPFTGSAVGVPRDDRAAVGAPGREERCIVAIFTRAVPPPLVSQRQNRAASCDGGRTFSADVHALSATPPELHYRDPKVFRFENPDDPRSATWMMVLAVGDFVELYRSDDLAGRWDRTDRLRIFTGALGSASNPFVETADLLRVPVEGEPDADAWVLTFAQGAVPPGTNEDWFDWFTQDVPTPSFYLTGRFDGRRFLADGAPTGEARADFNHRDIARRLDAGPDFYAAQSWHIDGTTSADFATRSPIVAAWVSNWNYALFLPTHAWQGQLSIPRTFALQRTQQGLRLTQQPVPEAELLRDRDPPTDWRLRDVPIDGSGHVIDLGGEKSYELLLDVDVGSANQMWVDFNDGPNRGSITMQWQRQGRSSGRLHLDRAQSFPLPRAPSGFVYEAALNRAAVDLVGNRMRIRVLVDRTSVEVFPEQAQAPLTALFYPHPDNHELRLRADGSGARIVSATVYDLDRSNIFLNRRSGGLQAAVRQRRETARVQTATVRARVESASAQGQRPDVKSLQRAVDGYLTALSKRNPRQPQRALWDAKARPTYTTVRGGTRVETDVLSGRSRARMRFLVATNGRVTDAAPVAAAKLKR